LAKLPSNEASVGPILALDLGEKRIGVAVSDANRIVARSVGVIKRASRKEDFKAITKIAEQEKAILIIMGLPYLPSGKEGSKAKWVRDYAADLEQQSGYGVSLWDESFSTVDAEISLRERGIHKKRRRKRVDAAAAAFILQSYLDSESKSAE
jgi:putative Holliday junction resolvase